MNRQTRIEAVAGPLYEHLRDQVDDETAQAVAMEIAQRQVKASDAWLAECGWTAVSAVPGVRSSDVSTQILRLRLPTEEEVEQIRGYFADAKARGYSFDDDVEPDWTEVAGFMLAYHHAAKMMEHNLAQIEAIVQDYRPLKPAKWKVESEEIRVTTVNPES